VSDPSPSDVLRTQIKERDQQIEMLTSELEETNRGVVALYAELDDKAVALKEAADLKSRFLSYMSHEFRTPLASMAGLVDLLQREVDGTLSAEQKRQTQFMAASIQELSGMVDDLLDLAKVEAGRVTISPEWFELVDLFSALRGMFKPIVATEAVSLIFEEPGAMPKAYTDNKRLSQILRNFISNALKFTDRGEVRVSVRLIDDDQVEFAVTDTGTGIAPEHIGTLFNDFVQLDSRVQKRLIGTGLGLSLSKKLAELLGGSVGVSSALGTGSRFWVRVPARYRNEAARAARGL
jgi:signal transduction histidine kinase